MHLNMLPFYNTAQTPDQVPALIGKFPELGARTAYYGISEQDIRLCPLSLDSLSTPSTGSSNIAAVIRAAKTVVPRVWAGLWGVGRSYGGEAISAADVALEMYHQRAYLLTTNQEGPASRQPRPVRLSPSPRHLVRLAQHEAAAGGAEMWCLDEVKIGTSAYSLEDFIREGTGANDLGMACAPWLAVNSVEDLDRYDQMLATKLPSAISFTRYVGAGSEKPNARYLGEIIERLYSKLAQHRLEIPIFGWFQGYDLACIPDYIEEAADTFLTYDIVDLACWGGPVVDQWPHHEETERGFYDSNIKQAFAWAAAV